MANNQIRDITPLAGLTRLAELYLRNNNISDISALSQLTRLKSLDLSGNPLNQEACDRYILQIEANNPGIFIDYDGCGPQEPAILEIRKAGMVSPSELGMGIRVKFPDNMPEGASRKVRFWATINHTRVEKVFTITENTEPGVWWEPELGDKDNPLRISLRDPDGDGRDDDVVPRFTANEDFELMGEAYYEGGPHSEPSKTQVTIPLPTIVLHGYIHYWAKGYPLFRQIPIVWMVGDAISYGVAYAGFTGFLESKGYGKKGPYRTLWDPRDFVYTSPWDAEPETIRRDVDRLLSKESDQTGRLKGEVWNHNYADKVNIIGHSFGGLVARYYSSVCPQNVNTVITAGTPHRGVTRFFVFAFTDYSSLADGQEHLRRPDGKDCIILWTVPRYECLLYENREPARTHPFESTFNFGEGEGVNCYSIYSAHHSTEYQLYVREKDDDWYALVTAAGTIDFFPLLGDGYVLEDSAKAFGRSQRVWTSENSQHAVLLNNREVQGRIYAILTGKPYGEFYMDDDLLVWFSGAIGGSEVVSRTVSVRPGVPMASFEVRGRASHFDLALLDPDAIPVDPDVAAVDPDIHFMRSDSYQQYTIASPMPGKWTIEIRATDVPETGEEYEASVFLLAGTASNPAPTDGAEAVTPRTVLTWTPGCRANSHRVYFGFDAADVNDGVNGTFKGTHAQAAYNPGPLEACQTYYWRVDEVNEIEQHTPWKGKVWSFSTCCPDFDGTDGVNLTDFARFATEWRSGMGHPYGGTRAMRNDDVVGDGAVSDDDAAPSTCGEPGWCKGADVNRNGQVDFHDLMILAWSWCEDRQDEK